MRKSNRNLAFHSTGLLAMLAFAMGWTVWSPLTGAAGALGILYVLQLALQTRRGEMGPGRESRDRPRNQATAESPQPLTGDDEPSALADEVRLAPTVLSESDRLVEAMLAQGRCALLLRPQIAPTLSEDQFRRAIRCLTDASALVPEGEVLLGQIDESADNSSLDDDPPADLPRVVRLEPFFLDRYPVTNEQYHEFVAGGGYAEAALWDPAILPAVLDFVDRTGQPGPRFWSGGTYEPAKKDHPVVGVSWYEASAYARWLGKRLPTDAEWVKAGCWPVGLTVGTGSQRRYPWGDTMDRTRANLWGSGPKGTAPVTAFPGGTSVGSVCQLIGNVWQWMRGNFPSSDSNDGDWLVETPMKSIRGGAFDTYFDNQAACQFQSGEAAIARKHNIGFRCAVGVCDLLLARSGEDLAPATPIPTVLAEEVPA